MPLSTSVPRGPRLSLCDPLLLRLLLREGPPFVASHLCSSLKSPSPTTSRLAPLSTTDVRCLKCNELSVSGGIQVPAGWRSWNREDLQFGVAPLSSHSLLGQQTQCLQGPEASEAVDEDHREACLCSLKALKIKETK